MEISNVRHSSILINKTNKIFESYISDKVVGMLHTEAQRSSGRLSWSSLGTLKLAFSFSSYDQGSHPDDIFVLVLYVFVYTVMVPQYRMI